jgi:hypothetical protein
METLEQWLLVYYETSWRPAIMQEVKRTLPVKFPYLSASPTSLRAARLVQIYFSGARKESLDVLRRKWRSVRTRAWTTKTRRR